MKTLVRNLPSAASFFTALVLQAGNVGSIDADFVVTNTLATGPGSLRDTLAAAPSGSTITFDPSLSGATIEPGSEIILDEDITIDATGLAIAPIISGSNSHRIFRVTSERTVVLTRLTLQNGNGDNSGLGGGVYNDGGKLTVNQSTFFGNHADNSPGGGGGGIYNSGTLTVNQSTLSGNHADNSIFGGGGGIYNSGTLTMNQSTLSGNHADNSPGGGGGSIYNRGTLTMNQSSLSGNHADSSDGGGGIFSNNSATLNQSTLSGNHADNALGGGGGILNDGTLTVSQSTLSGNQADNSRGGGIFSVSDSDGITLTNSLIAANIANSNGPDLYINPTGLAITTTGVNFIGDLSGSALSASDTLLTTAQNGPITLAPLAHYSGPTQTMPPMAGSPAIDATSAASVTDQRGFSAQDGDANGSVLADIGAAEAQVMLVTTATDEDNGNSTPANGTGTSLREAIADTSGHADIIRFDPAVFNGEPADVIRLTTGTQLSITRSLSVDARNLPSGVTLSGDVTNNGPDSSDTRIFYINTGQTVALHGLTLKNGNADGGNGGGIYNNGGTLTVNQSTLSANHADSGGGIYSTTSPNFTTASTRLTQCTVTGNTAASGLGGGIFNNSGRTTLTHCTVSGNAALTGNGSGVASFGNTSTDTVVMNSIISANNDSSVDFVGGATNSFTPQGRNLIGSGNAIGDFITNGDLINNTPMLASLNDNSGPTQTFALLPGSPALGAAVNSTTTTDQRGFPIVGTADLGAYESQGSTVTLASSANPSLLGQSVTFTATVNELDPQTITPTGTVTFTVDSVPVLLNASGIATLTTSALTSGPHTVSATYNGDARLLASTSSTVNQSVLDLSVSNTSDSGNGSLRQALINAAANPGPDTITLPLALNGQTLTLTSQMLINDAAGVTIDASGLSNGFRITNPNNAIHALIILATNSTLTVKGVWFDDGDNVAIYNNGTLTLSQCSFSRRHNGAITNNGGTLTMSQCTVVSNSKYLSGGAIYNNGGTLMLTQCTLCYNSSNFVGGAILNEGGILTLTHCTLSDNSATGGGAIYNSGGILTLTNSIVNWNSPVDIYNGGSNASFTRVGANLVRRYSNADSVADSGPLPITADPELAPLGNYGGPTSTRPPLPGSPAIDQASVITPTLTTDQRGQLRPIGARPDIGAVEVNLIEVTTHVDELDPTGAFGTGVSLREAIRDVEAGGIIAFDRAVFNSLTTNTITLTKGPLNPQRNATLNASNIPGGIKIVQTPTITSQPLPLRLGTGANGNFTIAVTNLSGGVTYQWRKDGNGLAGQTSPALVLNNVQGSDEALYDVRLTETATPGTLALTNVVLGAFEATSLPASLIVDGAPLTVQRGPASAMLALGAGHTLSVSAIGPAFSELTYQWFKGSAKVSGATKSSLTFARAALTDAGAYTCVVKTGLTSVTSTTAEIGVVDTMPKTVNLKEGDRFTATVNAAGNGLQPFYWKRSSIPLTPTASKFTIESVGVSDAGIYTCTVTGLAGTITAGCNTLLNVSSGPASIGMITLPPSAIGQTYYYKLPNEYNPGAPVTSFSMSGTLPTGITFNKTSGVLSGRPTVTKPGGYLLIFRAINAAGPSIVSNATLTVNILSTTAVGVFAGPLERSPLNDNLGGRFDLTTTAAGGFSGSLTLGARTKLSFTAQLLRSAGAGDVILYGSIPGMTMTDKTALTAYVEVFAVEQLARLTLTHPNGTTLLATAWRNTWSKTKLASAYAATYTARLDPTTVGNSPRGYGFATLTVAADGSVKTAGKLPDGSGLTQAGFVGPEGQLTLFNLLHAKRGSLVGPMQITPGSPVANNTLGGPLDWFKPGPLPKSTDTVYQAGFGPLNVTVEGSPYAAPAKGQRVMDLGTAPNPNAKLSFTLGGLAPEFAQLLHITNPSATGLTNKGNPTLPLTNTTKLTTLDAAKGLFTGSFVISGATTALNRPAPFEGLIVKIGSSIQGYGYFLLPSVPVAAQKVATSPKLSGRVVLGEP